MYFFQIISFCHFFYYIIFPNFNKIAIAYGKSIVADLISGISHTTNILISYIIKDIFNKTLDEAYKKVEKIQQRIVIIN